MPKQRITKEMVMDAAFKLLREGGGEQVLVKNIAAELSCSVQPIYSYCGDMDTLRQELAEMAGGFMREYVEKRLDKSNFFESTGKAYATFAAAEPHLFKSYFLRRRSGIESLDDLYCTEADSGMAKYIAKNLEISESSAKKLHMDMIIYNTGLSFMMISAGHSFHREERSEKLESAYSAFLTAIRNEEKNDERNSNL